MSKYANLSEWASSLSYEEKQKEISEQIKDAKLINRTGIELILENLKEIKELLKELANK